MTKPLLTLDTLITRPTVEIDGARYEILSPDELSVLDSRRFGLWAETLDDLQNPKAGAERSAEDCAAELEQLVDTIARKVLVAVPADVFGKLTGQHKIAVVEVFTMLLVRRRMSAAGAMETALASLSNGASSSPVFSGSTEERRGSGWRKRLWRWFARTPG